MNESMNTSVSTSETEVRSMKVDLKYDDFRNLIEPFNGLQNVRNWITRAEELFELFQIEEIKRYVLGKRLLDGNPKTVVEVENKEHSWKGIKDTLLREYDEERSMKEVIQQMSNMKMEPDEDRLRYSYRVKQFGDRFKVDDASILEVIIDNFEETTVEKTILYEAKTFEDFKPKLKFFTKMYPRSTIDKKDYENVSEQISGQFITPYFPISGSASFRGTRFPNHRVFKRPAPRLMRPPWKPVGPMTPRAQFPGARPQPRTPWRDQRGPTPNFSRSQPPAYHGASPQKRAQ